MDDKRGADRRDLESDGAIVPESHNKIMKSSCSLLSIFAILIIIFLIICGGIFYLKYKDFSFSISHSQSSNGTTVINKLQNQVSSLPSGQSAEVKISEADLNQIIQSDSAFPLKKPTAKINTDKIVLSGKTSGGIFGISVDVGVVPEAKSGKLVLNIIEIKAAGVSAPKQIAEGVNSSLGQYLNNSLPLADNIDVTKVELSSGFLTITGTKK